MGEEETDAANTYDILQQATDPAAGGESTASIIVRGHDGPRVMQEVGRGDGRVDGLEREWGLVVVEAVGEIVGGGIGMPAEACSHASK